MPAALVTILYTATGLNAKEAARLVGERLSLDEVDEAQSGGGGATMGAKVSEQNCELI